MTSEMKERGKLFQGITDTRPEAFLQLDLFYFDISVLRWAAPTQTSGRGVSSHHQEPNTLQLSTCSRHGNWSKHWGWSRKLSLQADLQDWLSHCCGLVSVPCTPCSAGTGKEGKLVLWKSQGQTGKPMENAKIQNPSMEASSSDCTEHGTF